LIVLSNQTTCTYRWCRCSS